MSSVLPKQSYEPGISPAPSELEVGELAVNVGDGKLFTRLTSGEVVPIVPDFDRLDRNLTETADIVSYLSSTHVGYSSGTWNPKIVTVNSQTVTAVQPTVTYANGCYARWVRMNDIVIVEAGVYFSSTGGAGIVQITGLPFRRASSTQGPRLRGFGSVTQANIPTGRHPNLLVGRGDYDIAPQWQGISTISGGSTQYVDNNNLLAEHISDAGNCQLAFGYVYQTIEQPEEIVA